MSFDTPETLPEFFERLASGIFPSKDGRPPKVPQDFIAFREHCEQRYERGVGVFGDAWRRRDNRQEALEEAVDLANYMHFDVLKHLAETGTDEDLALALTAAQHAYLAHKAVRELARKRAGDP